MKEGYVAMYNRPSFISLLCRKITRHPLLMLCRKIARSTNFPGPAMQEDGLTRHLPCMLCWKIAQPAIFPARYVGKWPNRPSSMGRLWMKMAGWAIFLHSGPMEDGRLRQHPRQHPENMANRPMCFLHSKPFEDGVLRQVQT